MAIIIFPSDPIETKAVDREYHREHEEAKAAGLEVALVDLESLRDGQIDRALRKVLSRASEVVAIYRGWMLKVPVYQRFYDALRKRSLKLINDPEAYKRCHFLPESYGNIESCTPKTVWLKMTPDFRMEKVFDLLAPFGSAAVVVEDYVKSQKHYWAEACYIPSASDKTAVEKVVRRFLELQDDDLNEGLVFREFVEFESLGKHPKSGMPLSREYRVFVLDGRPMYATQYWDEVEYGNPTLPSPEILKLVPEIESRFFTTDLARTVEGRWMIVELGDGQVAGLPIKADPTAFYAALKNNLTE